MVEGIAFKPANQVDPGSNPTRGIRTKIWSLDRKQQFKKYNSIVNWLMAKKAEKSQNQLLFTFEYSMDIILYVCCLNTIVRISIFYVRPNVPQGWAPLISTIVEFEVLDNEMVNKTEWADNRINRERVDVTAGGMIDG